MNYRFFAMLTLSASAVSAYAFPAGIVSPATSVQVGAQAKPISLPGESSPSHDKDSQKKRSPGEDLAAHPLSTAAIEGNTIGKWLGSLRKDESGQVKLKGCVVKRSANGGWVLESGGRLIEISALAANSPITRESAAPGTLSGNHTVGPAFSRELGIHMGSSEGVDLRFDPAGNLIEARFFARETRITPPNADNPKALDESSSSELSCQ